MTQDEIVSIARTVGFPTDYNDKRLLHHDLVIRLFGLAATFGAAKEREACAQIIDASWETTNAGEGIPEDWLLTLSELIRARGERQ